MGHEIGHALAHHGAERMAQERLAAIGAQAGARSPGCRVYDPRNRSPIMSSEANELLPVVRVVTPEVPVLDADLTHAAEARQVAPTSEQERAADGIFAAHKEQDPAADLMVLWSSALV